MRLISLPSIAAAFLLIVASASAHADYAQDAHERAQRVRAAFEITDGYQQYSHSVTAPMGEVFDQGRTNWCWAYAAFHTLRSYYFNVEPSENSEPWREALAEINDPDTFANLLRRYRHPSMGDRPGNFLNILSTENELPREPWGRMERGQYGNRALIEKLRANLDEGIPSVWCGMGHCLTIYGGEFEDDGTATSFEIADSSSGRDGTEPLLYTANAMPMISNADLIYVRKN